MPIGIVVFRTLTSYRLSTLALGKDSLGDSRPGYRMYNLKSGMILRTRGQDTFSSDSRSAFWRRSRENSPVVAMIGSRETEP